MKNDSSNSQEASLLAKDAIGAAISLDWKKAIEINQKILKIVKEDVETLNRLARAYICSGKKEEAQKLYKKALDIDPFNIIARKNLEKITTSAGIKTNGTVQNHSIKSGLNLANLFLFEPGKTKLVNLLNLAPPAILVSLNCGDEVLINPKNHSVSITTTTEKTYLGALPDDLAHRLISFINGGNQYDAYVKNATPKLLSIFIREVFRSPKFASQPSFHHKQLFQEETEPAYI